MLDTWNIINVVLHFRPSNKTVKTQQFINQKGKEKGQCESVYWIFLYLNQTFTPLNNTSYTVIILLSEAVAEVVEVTLL